MKAKTTEQGTAAAETGLCDSCAKSSENRATVERQMDADVTGPWVDCGDNDMIGCQVCGNIESSRFSS